MDAYNTWHLYWHKPTAPYSTSKYFLAAVLPSLSPLPDRGNQQIELQKDRVDRASLLMTQDSRSLSGCADGKSTCWFMSGNRQGSQHWLVAQ